MDYLSPSDTDSDGLGPMPGPLAPQAFLRRLVDSLQIPGYLDFRAPSDFAAIASAVIAVSEEQHLFLSPSEKQVLHQAMQVAMYCAIVLQPELPPATSSTDAAGLRTTLFFGNDRDIRDKLIEQAQHNEEWLQGTIYGDMDLLLRTRPLADCLEGERFICERGRGVEVAFDINYTPGWAAPAIFPEDGDKVVTGFVPNSTVVFLFA